MTEDVQLNEIETIGLEAVDSRVEFVGLADRLVELQKTIGSVARMDGVSLEMAAPFKNVLPENTPLNSFTKTPTQTNLEEFKSVFGKIYDTSMLDITSSLTKTVKLLERLVSSNVIDKEKFTVTVGDEVNVDKASAEFDELVNPFNRFDSESAFEPQPITEEIFSAGAFVYSDFINELIDCLELTNQLRGMKLEEASDRIFKVREKLIALDGKLLETLSNYSDAYNAKTIHDLMASMREYVNTLKASVVETEFSADDYKDQYVESKGAMGVVTLSSPFMQYDDAVGRRIASVATELEKANGGTFFDKEGYDPVEMEKNIGSMDALMTHLSMDLNFLIVYTSVRVEMLTQNYNFVKALSNSTK